MNGAPLTAREAYQPLRDVAMGISAMRQVSLQRDAGGDEVRLTVEIDGWTMIVCMIGGSLDRCDSCTSPQGRSGSSRVWARYGTDPTALLSAWERAQLEQQLNAEGFRSPH